MRNRTRTNGPRAALLAAATTGLVGAGLAVTVAPGARRRRSATCTSTASRRGT